MCAPINYVGVRVHAHCMDACLARGLVYAPAAVAAALDSLKKHGAQNILRVCERMRIRCCCVRLDDWNKESVACLLRLAARE